MRLSSFLRQAEMDALQLDEFNTKLAKLMQRLKKDAGATSIAQNYKGTGSQKFRRQLWVHFKSGAVIDLWLEKRLTFGGVVMRGPAGEFNHPIKAKYVSYEGHTPESVYAEAAKILKEWATPAAVATAARVAAPEGHTLEPVNAFGGAFRVKVGSRIVGYIREKGGRWQYSKLGGSDKNWSSAKDRDDAAQRAIIRFEMTGR